MFACEPLYFTYRPGYCSPCSESPSGSSPLPLSVKWGLWEVSPHLYHLKMLLKVGGACGRQPIGALPGQTDTVLSSSSVSSGSVLAGGRCQRHRPAKQSVLLKGVACPTHTHMITHDHTNRGMGLVSNQSFC